MQLIYIIGIYEDNYNTVHERFETDSVNMMKKNPCCKKNKEILIYISLAQSIRKPWKLLLGTTTLKSFVSHIGLWETLGELDDLENYWANATCNL